MCILKGGSGSRWVDRLRVGVGYPVWGFRIEKNLQILDLQRLASLQMLQSSH